MSKILNNFMAHLEKYEKLGPNLYCQKGYSRFYTKKEVINHFNKKL